MATLHVLKDPSGRQYIAVREQGKFLARIDGDYWTLRNQLQETMWALNLPDADHVAMERRLWDLVMAEVTENFADIAAEIIEIEFTADEWDDGWFAANSVRICYLVGGEPYRETVDFDCAELCDELKVLSGEGFGQHWNHIITNPNKD
ncbi:hypothetical protein SEA_BRUTONGASTER_154 [Gordonia phage BrutonGaster]|uniref:Uncharacterized protein n=1 Tax=Gordonia phage BrutonGaster TaxID=2530116 RepID=A0A482JHE4_9CAUD|nr:hypothetical protein HOV26_gp028 [Gordonia phage BrutonGaster]QBP33368.1 hypothetical protein SEA_BRUTONGASTER_154 [Gordonia phage BrutonGaster]